MNIIAELSLYAYTTIHYPGWHLEFTDRDSAVVMAADGRRKILTYRGGEVMEDAVR